MDNSQKYQIVNDGYSEYARKDHNASYSQTVATAFGYSPEELSSVPDGANLGLSCGNPLGTAKLQKVQNPIMPFAVRTLAVLSLLENGQLTLDLVSSGRGCCGSWKWSRL